MLSKRYTYRFELVGIFSGVLISVLLIRLIFLQVVDGDYYKRQADGNRIRTTPIIAPRGNFLDRYGRVLVNNRPGFVVSLSLTKNSTLNNESVQTLAKILQVDPQTITEKIASNKDVDRVILKSDVSPEIISALEERKRDFPNIFIEIQPIRTYLNKSLAAHVLGYVGEINEQELARLKTAGYRSGSILGKMGLEKKYDDILRGKDGADRVEVNVSGQAVDKLSRQEPTPGMSMQLTLDLDLQKVAEQAMDEQLEYLRKYGGSPKAFAGAVVVLDPNTGAVLAMVSRPTFDPNLFATGISYKDWRLINENPNHPLDNKAISGEYPPGSTFKIVTAAAALDSGKVTPDEKIFDPGFHALVPDKGNDDGKALGWIDLKTALAKSDNVYFYEMGVRLGIETLEKYARKFGFGAPTGINLYGESEGLVANPGYKQRVFKEDWYLAETFDATIGQGFHLATPLQLAVATSAIANGGTVYRPYLIEKVFNEQGKTIQEFKKTEVSKLGLSPANIRAIAAGMRGVAVAGGTASQLSDFPIPIAGKTGTAENPHGKAHGVFVGYAPYENPSLVVAIIVDQGGYASISVVPIARKIFAAAFGIKEN